jgi:hypothetical protein
MFIDRKAISTPFLDLGELATRDPAIHYAEGLFQCYFTVAKPQGNRYQLCLGRVESADLAHWSAPFFFPESPLNFSSPGNVLKVGQEWVLCVQSYPVDPGAVWGNESSRLWLMRSPNLLNWGQPRMICPQGCEAAWTASHRQIDPYLVEHAGQFYCLYKTSGQLGLLVSPDLEHWQEAQPGAPVLSAKDTPDGSSLENPCVLPVAGGYALFFAPCRPGRGIGLAYSQDLLAWRDVHFLDFPALPWANNGPTAGMVLDLRRECGYGWMAFHGERDGRANAHSAALALAWSEDLEHWRLP